MHVRALVSILENFRFSLDDSLQHQAESAEDMEAEEDLAEHEPHRSNPREHKYDVKKVSGAVSMSPPLDSSITFQIGMKPKTASVSPFPLELLPLQCTCQQARKKGKLLDCLRC